MRPISWLFCCPNRLALALCFTLMLAGNIGVLSAAAQDSSLDSIWMDQSDKLVKKSGAATTAASALPIGNKNQNRSGQELSSADTPASNAASEAFAPLCTVDEFKNSALVSKGGWPGTGPFKGNDSGSYVDEHQNKIAVQVSGDAVTRAELTLTGKSNGNSQKDLLDMQMNIDFLLEAVNIQPKNIQKLNQQLEQNKGALLRNEETPLNLTTGRFLVNISKRHNGEANGGGYVIAVNSLDADKRVLKQHALGEASVPAIPAEKDKHTAGNTEPLKVKKPDSKATNATTDSLQDQFIALVKEWQRVKKNAVRSRQAEELSTVLAGKALVRQTDAIKWLLANKKYYEMNPRGVRVERFTELTPAKKYAVAAQVHEAYKFIDEATGQVLKEVDDVNRVTYTVEKANGRWVITDSALQTNAQAKTATPNKTTR